MEEFQPIERRRRKRVQQIERRELCEQYWFIIRWVCSYRILTMNAETIHDAVARKEEEQA
jgi:hypothetical protein